MREKFMRDDHALRKHILHKPLNTAMTRVYHAGTLYSLTFGTRHQMRRRLYTAYSPPPVGSSSPFLHNKS